MRRAFRLSVGWQSWGLNLQLKRFDTISLQIVSDFNSVWALCWWIAWRWREVHRAFHVHKVICAHFRGRGRNNLRWFTFCLVKARQREAKMRTVLNRSLLPSSTEEKKKKTTSWISQGWNWNSSINSHPIQLLLFNCLMIWTYRERWFGHGTLKCSSNQFSFCCYICVLYNLLRTLLIDVQFSLPNCVSMLWFFFSTKYVQFFSFYVFFSHTMHPEHLLLFFLLVKVLPTVPESLPLHLPTEKSRFPCNINCSWPDKMQHDWAQTFISRLGEATQWEERGFKGIKGVSIRVPQKPNINNHNVYAEDLAQTHLNLWERPASDWLNLRLTPGEEAMTSNVLLTRDRNLEGTVT